MKYAKNEAKEWARANLPGIGGGIIQPLNDDYSINYDGTAAWINRQIEMSVDSIICDGACGEWITFTVEERKKIYEVAAKTVDGRVPLIANTSHPSISSAVELAKHAQDVGCDALMHCTPYANSSSDDGVYRYYKYLADRVDIAICLYNTKPTGYLLSPEFINELAEKIIEMAKLCGVDTVYSVIATHVKKYVEEPQVFGVATSPELLQYLESKGVEIADGNLQISGVNGLVVESAKRNGINGISLLCESVFPEALDIKACHAGIKKVSGLLGIDIDMSRIESEAKKFDEGFKRYLKDMQEKKRKEEDLGYIS